MRALVYDGEQLQLKIGLPTPGREGDQVLIKVIMAGICNTDIEITRGYMGFSGILGHEFVGKVTKGPDHLLGKRVVGEINVACGACEFCHRGVPSQCSNRTTVGIDRHPGAFADYLALTEQNVHVVPDNVGDEAAVFVEPLAAALQVPNEEHVKPGQRVVVIGAGKLGLLVAQVLRLMGANLVVVIRHDKQADILDKWGIPHASVLPERSADVVVDCTGTEGGFKDGLEIVKPRGKIILKSTYTGELPRVNLTKIVVDEVKVVGNRCGPFEAALRLLASGLIDTETLIEAQYSFDEAMNAFGHAQQKGVLKVLLDL